MFYVHCIALSYPLPVFQFKVSAFWQLGVMLGIIRLIMFVYV